MIWFRLRMWMHAHGIEMRRPMIWLSVPFAVGIAYYLYDSRTLPLKIAVPIVAAAVILGLWQKRLLPIALVVIGLLAGVGYGKWYDDMFQYPAEQYRDTTRYVTATVLDYAVQYEENQRVEVKIQGNDKTPDFRTLLYVPLTEHELEPGDRISGEISFYIPTKQDGFERKIYYQSKGYWVLASMEKIQKLQTGKHPLTYYPKWLSHCLQQIYSQHGTVRQAAFWRALIVGDRTQLTAIDQAHLRKAGLSHVIALSGMHVGFLVSILFVLFGKRIGTALGIPVLIVFASMVGWSPSVIRACIMYGIMMAGFWLKRQADSINSLFAALFFILLYLPNALQSVSLQLSFAATLGILLLCPKLYQAYSLSKRQKRKLPRLLQKLWYFVMGTVSCSIGATLLTVPILLYHFGNISAFSVLSNLLALWAVTAVFPIAAVGGIVGFFHAGIAQVILIPAGWLTNYIWSIADFSAALPYGILYYENKTDFAAAIVICVLAALVIYFASPNITAAAIPTLLILTAGISIYRGSISQDDLRISVLPEGSGQAILVTNGQYTTLIDCGSSGYHDPTADITEYMDWYGIESIDQIIVTAVDGAHVGGISSLLDAVSVKKVILPEENAKPELYEALIQKFQKTDTAFRTIAPEKEMSIGRGELGISVLGYAKEKFIVRIQSEDQNVLIVHALTQKMLLDLTEQTRLTCDTLVISDSFLKDWQQSKELVKRFQPNLFILESGWQREEEIKDIPVLTADEVGQIDLKTARNTKGW